MNSPYRDALEVSRTPAPLEPVSISNRFKSYLAALEYLAMDLPSILEDMEREYGEDSQHTRRLRGHLARIQHFDEGSHG